MKKMALVIAAMSLVSLNSWGCSFDKSIAALKGVDKAAVSGKSYTMIPDDKNKSQETIVISNDNGQFKVGGIPACASGGKGSASLSVPGLGRATMRKSGRVIRVSYSNSNGEKGTGILRF